ncbi:hypothetical protein C8J57DRAFT_1501388 [Mycena rebaudengoi]|nr:hypothetical protein C8J57DRAFT_1501388 [Mycena rebaudengoi]
MSTGFPATRSTFIQRARQVPSALNHPLHPALGTFATFPTLDPLNPPPPASHTNPEARWRSAGHFPARAHRHIRHPPTPPGTCRTPNPPTHIHPPLLTPWLGHSYSRKRTLPAKSTLHSQHQYLPPLRPTVNAPPPTRTARPHPPLHSTTSLRTLTRPSHQHTSHSLGPSAAVLLYHPPTSSPTRAPAKLPAPEQSTPPAHVPNKPATYPLVVGPSIHETPVHGTKRDRPIHHRTAQALKRAKIKTQKQLRSPTTHAVYEENTAQIDEEKKCLAPQKGQDLFQDTCKGAKHRRVRNKFPQQRIALAKDNAQ